MNENSAYRPWRRPKLTADIQPLRKIFEENPPDISVPSPISEQPSTSTTFLTRTGRLANDNCIFLNPCLNNLKQKAK